MPSFWREASPTTLVFWSPRRSTSVALRMALGGGDRGGRSSDSPPRFPRSVLVDPSSHQKHARSGSVTFATVPKCGCTSPQSSRMGAAPDGGGGGVGVPTWPYEQLSPSPSLSAAHAAPPPATAVAAASPPPRMPSVAPNSSSPSSVRSEEGSAGGERRTWRSSAYYDAMAQARTQTPPESRCWSDEPFCASPWFSCMLPSPSNPSPPPPLRTSSRLKSKTLSTSTGASLPSPSATKPRRSASRTGWRPSPHPDCPHRHPALLQAHLVRPQSRQSRHSDRASPNRSARAAPPHAAAARPPAAPVRAAGGWVGAAGAAGAAGREVGREVGREGAVSHGVALPGVRPEIRAARSHRPLEARVWTTSSNYSKESP